MSIDDVPDQSPTRWPLVIGIIVVAAGLFAALFLFGSDGDSEPSATTDTSTPTTEPAATTEATASTEPPATTEPPQISTTDPTMPAQPREAMWPWADTGLRFDDPTVAAASFATDFLGFTDPIIGDFQSGDSRSGEVEIRPRPDGELTVVLVRQLSDDDTWWVLGSAAEGIAIDTPAQGAEIASPLVLSGQARAFEGTVGVELRVDGNDEPVATSFVTGGAGPELQPFEGSVEFTNPGDAGGALVLLSVSPEDGSVVEASALRISYAP